MFSSMRDNTHLTITSRLGFWQRNLSKSENENKFLAEPDVKIMDEESSHRLDNGYFNRSNGLLSDQIKDLNKKVIILLDDNIRLRKELDMIKTESVDKIKSKDNAQKMPLKNHASNEIQRSIAADFFDKHRSNCKIEDLSSRSGSWSELRSRRIKSNGQFDMKTPSLKEKYSGKSFDILMRNKSLRESDSSLYSVDKVRRLKPLNDKRISMPLVSTSLTFMDWMNICGSRSKINRADLLHISADCSDSNIFRLMDDCDLWSTDDVCAFLNQIGLGIYVDNCRRRCIDGIHLIQFNRKRIEKELNIVKRLHLKRLVVHLRLLTSTNVPSAASFCNTRPNLKISSNFDIRLWLDDIGLLHFINLFSSNGIDGLMLDQISLDDLRNLKINNEMHVLSLKRGIQLLREIDYDLSALVRRFPDSHIEDKREGDTCDNVNVSCSALPGEVCRWSSHQVMEWLRRIELPEYASNVRGAGVHGALFILEDRFNANSLASVLNIPADKSLLRRHLQTKFVELIGPTVMRKKMEFAEREDYSELTIALKMKFHRKTALFSILKRDRFDEYTEELLVPYSTRIENLDLQIGHK